jgi:Protein of unknown function DUF262
MNHIPGQRGHDWSPMDYRNLDLKIDQFVAYLNDDKINLIPPFQRGHVWDKATRQKLIQNIVHGRPIPAIFLYREASGSKYDYNILDGKQRLESLILFIGDHHSELKVNEVHKYFFDKKLRDLANFGIDMGENNIGLAQLPDKLLRDFRDYIIPTIEITLDEDHPAALDEMISLFVDINSYGEPVKRFDIVKAMSKDALLKSAFSVIARKETRSKDIFYKSKKNEFTRVLQRLQVVSGVRAPNAQVDKMWELMVEIVLFLRTREHKNPLAILKSFIKVSEPANKKIAPLEAVELRKVFNFLNRAYKENAISKTRIVTNQIHFYTVITSVIADNLIVEIGEVELTRKLGAFGAIIDETEPSPKSLARAVNQYRQLSLRQSTHVSRRQERHQIFLRVIREL